MMAVKQSFNCLDLDNLKNKPFLFLGILYLKETKILLEITYTRCVRKQMRRAT